jgi:hypothetical protein
LFLTCKHPAGVDPAGNKQYARKLRKIAWADIKPKPQEAERLVSRQAGLHLPATSPLSYFSPDGKTFVTRTDGIDKFSVQDSLRVWDTTTATLTHAHTMKGKGVLSPDGKWFVFAKPRGVNQAPVRVQLLAVRTNRVIDTALTSPGDDIPQVMFTHDSKSFWLRRNNDFVRYDIMLPKDGGPRLVPQQPLKLKQPNDPRPVSIIPSLDHKTFLVERTAPGGLLPTRTLYSSADGKELPLPKLAPGQWSSYLNLRRVVGSQVELHDFLNGIAQAIGEQRGPIGVSAIHPKRKYAATTEIANNQTLRTNLWDLEERCPLLTLPEFRAHTVTAIRFSADGHFLALVTSDAWTRIVPMEWLLQQKAQLPCPPNDVARP